MPPSVTARSKRKQRDVPDDSIRRVSPDTSDAEDCGYPDYPSDPFIGLNPKNDDGTIDHFMSLREYCCYTHPFPIAAYVHRCLLSIAVSDQSLSLIDRCVLPISRPIAVSCRSLSLTHRCPSSIAVARPYNYIHSFHMH